jgi:hypothetical protein
MTAASRESGDDFWRKLILPEEDRRSRFPGMASVVSARRWFRSANVVDLLRYRRRRASDNSGGQQA